MHEYSTDTDVVARVRREFFWAIEWRRRYVEVRPEDVQELLARVAELEGALRGLVAESTLPILHSTPAMTRARAALAAGAGPTEEAL